MKADHRHPPAGRQHIKRRAQTVSQVVQLTIDKDANTLKSTGCRVLTLFPGGVGFFNDGSEVCSAGKRLLGAAGYHSARHALGKTLFAVLLEHSRNIRLAGAVDPVGCALPRRGIHAHVQRAVIEKAEAAGRVIQLRRGHAQIQQNALYLPGQTACAQFFSHLGKGALYNDKAAVFGR